MKKLRQLLPQNEDGLIAIFICLFVFLTFNAIGFLVAIFDANWGAVITTLQIDALFGAVALSAWLCIYLYRKLA